MGLSISGSTTDKTYDYSYSGIHLVRWLALRVCGAPEKWKHNGETTFGWQNHPWINPLEHTAPRPDDITDYNWAFMQAGYYFPNLMFHSDCEGSYTPRGKVFKKDNLTSGSSKELLKELEFLKEELKNINVHENDRAVIVFNTLYELVKDEVENGKGVIKFH